MATSDHTYTHQPCGGVDDLCRSIGGAQHTHTLVAAVGDTSRWVKLPTRILSRNGATPRKTRLSQAIRTALPCVADPLFTHVPPWCRKAPVAAEQQLADEMRDAVDRAAIERLRRRYCVTDLTVMDEAHHVKREGALSTLAPHIKRPQCLN